jgi:hypothetical protein
MSRPNATPISTAPDPSLHLSPSPLLMGMGILPLVEMACGRRVNWVKRLIVGVAWHCDVL